MTRLLGYTVLYFIQEGNTGSIYLERRERDDRRRVREKKLYIKGVTDKEIDSIRKLF